MIVISVIDLISLAGFAAAAYYLVLGWKVRPAWREEILLLGISIILIASHNTKCLLEMAGLVYPLDAFEKYFDMLTVLFGGGFLYSMLQKATEETLRDKEEWYRLLFQRGNDAILVHGIEENGGPGIFKEVNDIACERYGYIRQEFLRLSPKDLNDPETTTDAKEIMDQMARDGYAIFERIHLAKDGTKIPVEVSAHWFVFDGVPTVISMVRDLSKRKEAERKLMEVQALDERILESSPVAFILTDAEGRMVRISKAFEEVTGYAREEAEGRTLKELIPDGPEREDIVSRLEKALKEGISLGPELDGGDASLLLVSDDGGGALQSLYPLRIAFAPEPGATSQLLSGLLLLAALTRIRQGA